MIINKLFKVAPICLIFLLNSACNKKCKVESKDTNSGEIISNVIIYPSSGSMTANMGDDLVVDANHKNALDYQISFSTNPREAVDYNNYTILCYPTTVSCNASFERNVTIDHQLAKVTYKITATQCKDCWTDVYVENYVLVPSFPSDYEVVYDVSIVDKN